MKENRIQIVGAIPNPIGGVSTFIYRLSYLLSKSHIEHTILDLYPSANKLDVPSECYVVKSGSILSRVFFLRRKLVNSSENIVFFNFSSVRSLLIFSFLKKKNERWVLMLHNGELAFPGKLKTLLKFILKINIKKFDKVMFISERQYRFYLDEMGYSIDSLVNMKSYIPASVVDSKVDDKVCEKLDNIVLANGYIKPLYNFEFLIRFASDFPNYNVVIVTYGEPNRDYLEIIQNMCSGMSNVHVLEQISPVAFISLLSRSRLYARPNFIDSFGIAVADAISLGVPVVASNVCERTKGAIIFEPNSYEDFLMAIDKALCNDSPVQLPSIASVQTEFINKIGL